MSVWDKTTPTGSDNAREGDDRIREAKEALEDALSHEGTFPGASPSTTPIFIPHMLYDTTANRPTGDSLVSGRFYFNTTLQALERYNGSSWDVVGVAFPAGTKMVFYQANAPTGWTAEAVNDKFLRVVTSGGTGGTTGGTVAASTSLAHSHTVDSHTHDLGNHTHAGPSHTHSIPVTGWSGSNNTASVAGTVVIVDAGGDSTMDDTDLASATAAPATGSGGTGNTGTPSTNTSGGATPGTDSQLGAFAYADVIIATKD